MIAPLIQPRVRIQRQAKAGETIEIRTLIEHPMETGLRHEGAVPVPRNLLNRLLVKMNGETLFAAELRNGVAANPYHVFFARIERTSDFEFVWTDENGRWVNATARVTVA